MFAKHTGDEHIVFFHPSSRTTPIPRESLRNWYVLDVPLAKLQQGKNSQGKKQENSTVFSDFMHPAAGGWTHPNPRSPHYNQLRYMSVIICGLERLSSAGSTQSISWCWCEIDRTLENVPGLRDYDESPVKLLLSYSQSRTRYITPRTIFDVTSKRMKSRKSGEISIKKISGSFVRKVCTLTRRAWFECRIGKSRYWCAQGLFVRFLNYLNIMIF